MRLAAAGRGAFAGDVALADLDAAPQADPCRPGAEPITGSSPGAPGRACSAARRVLTEAGGLGGPAAVGLAGAGRVPQQEEAGPAAVAHHRAHPPVIAVHHRVKIRLGPPAVHCGQGWKQPGQPAGHGHGRRGDPGKAGGARAVPPLGPGGCRRSRTLSPKPCSSPRDPPSFPRGSTSAEGLVAQPAAAAVPALAPLQLLVPALAAPHADGRRARPVGVQLSWGRR